MPVLLLIYWIMHKECPNEYSVEVMQVMLNILSKKSGKEAYMAMKIGIDIFKIQKNNIESYAKPFFDVVVSIYQKLSDTIITVFAEFGSEVSLVSFKYLYLQLSGLQEIRSRIKKVKQQRPNNTISRA